MREVALEVPKVKWNDIGGNEDVKQKLKEIVEWPQKQSAAISHMGVDPPHGVLLHRPGKTLMARAVEGIGAGSFWFALRVFEHWSIFMSAVFPYHHLAAPFKLRIVQRGPGNSVLGFLQSFDHCRWIL
ncbi:hypothetical protein R1flu_017667 [Riccia fluitans]|uniref:Uncharacterized protein n=1 Tax=Riccia fluitans TaxID=41844 RepID=A0ABD1ZH07_9MARC